MLAVSAVGVRHGEPVPNKKLFQLTPIGEIAERYWLEIPRHYPNIALDEFVIMPDHVHGILKIRGVGDVRRGNMDGVTRNCNGNCIVGVRHGEPLRETDHPFYRSEQPSPHPPNDYRSWQRNEYQHIIPQSLGMVVNHFKSAVTRWTRQNGFPQFKWQRSFYDHVIRNARSLFSIRQYIRNNPENWVAASGDHLAEELEIMRTGFA
jgi:putative transposase